MLQNRIIWIYWQMWSWKTLYAVILSSLYNRVFANFKIKGHKDAIFLKNIFEIEKVEKQEQKWLLILDEANLNFSGRDSMSNKNKSLIKLLLLSRKKNLDFVIVWQDFGWVDKYVRNLSEVVYLLHKIPRGNYFDVMLKIYTKRWSIEWWFFLNKITYLKDPIKLLWKLNIKYDTTDLSIL